MEDKYIRQTSTRNACFIAGCMNIYKLRLWSGIPWHFVNLNRNSNAIGKSLQPRLLCGLRGQVLDYRCDGREVCIGSVFLRATKSSLLQIF